MCRIVYNVRLIEYPTGYQIRVYTGGCVGAGVEDIHPGVDWIDYINGDLKMRRDPDALPVDVWVESPVDFDGLEGFFQEMEQDKRAESIRVASSRAKNNVYYLARSNMWDWFVTLTVAPSENIDRYDYDDVSKKARKFFNNLRQRKAPDMYYLIVPEQHQDGAWHMHALLGGCSGLQFVDSGHADRRGNVIYNFENWKFGFSTATAVTDTRRVSSYISKYITKSLVSSTKGKQRYWVSNNCKRAPVEDYFVDGTELKKYMQLLREHMLHKSAVTCEFFQVHYFELPLESPADDDFFPGHREHSGR